MSRFLSGWREYAIAFLAILDCFISLSFFPFLSSLFVLEYLISVTFRYVMPFLLILHYSIDSFRWQLDPLYLQLICIICSNAYISNSTITTTANPSTTSLSEISSPSNTLISTARILLFTTCNNSQFGYATSGIAILNFRFVNLMLRILFLFKVPCACLSFFLCWLFPLPSFPEPDGSWGCGVEEFQFDASIVHQQLRTPDELQQSSSSPLSDTQSGRPLPRSNPRTFQTLMFYPIEKHRHKNEGRYRWLPLGRRSTTGLSRMIGVPRILFEYLTRLETQSVILAPLSKKRRRYPIAFLSHGIGMMKTSQSLLCQVL